MLAAAGLAGVTTWSVLRGGDGVVAWWVMPLMLTLVLAGSFLGIGPLMRREHRRMAERAADVGVRPTPEEAAEDARWTASGMLNDPDEPNVFVSKREGHGTGITVNVGTRAGRLLVTAFVTVFAVLLPLAFWLSAFVHR